MVPSKEAIEDTIEMGISKLDTDDRTDHKLQCFTTGVSSSFDKSTSSELAEFPSDKFDTSSSSSAEEEDPTLLRSLSPNSLQGMSQSASEVTAGCLQGERSPQGSFGVPEQQEIPRRNLTEAFEELYIKPKLDTDPTASRENDGKDNAMTNLISPTGVVDFPSTDVTPVSKNKAEATTPHTITTTNTDDDATTLPTTIPHIELHQSLKRDLSKSLVDRVAFYAIIHDINKEATTMSAHDESGYNRNPEDLRESYDPLVVAVNGQPTVPLPPSHSLVDSAAIDEEKWLLEAIDGRSDESRGVKECPPTFLQAMGERDYENPLTSLSSGSRTQLWKPSRSWWEAKSGKNPWIEPKSHNKRWRYLWPLIHYHKFLARCIKKLKRNGIDVKNSVSPVSVFLREEVCSVSDHLAAVSLFDSDQWMECLKDFHGWTDPREEAEEIVRNLISQLKLRPMNEPGDVDSPLLRNQIDEQYLRAMASARAQMAGAVSQGDKRSSRETPSSGKRGPSPRENKSKISRGYDATSGHPPAYPRHASPGFVQQNQGNGMPHSSGRRSRFGYPPQAGGQWYGQQNWNPNGQFPYGEDVSVHSGISGDNFAHQYDPNYHGGMPPQYYNPMMYPQHPMPTWPLQTGFDPSLQDPSLMEPYVAEQGPPPGWYSHPHSSGMFPSQPSEMGGMVPGTPGGPLASHDMSAASGMDPSQQIGGDHTPYKYNPSQVPMSPYWGHLDHGTLAMMGIASPHAPSAPQTPARSSTRGTGSFDGSQDASAISAQPLLLRQQYAGYGYGATEGYGPPSPATQFMMSPQANFSYNYGYGFSPVRESPSSKKYNNSPQAGTVQSTQAAMTPTRGNAEKNQSPDTVVTTAESEECLS